MPEIAISDQPKQTCEKQKLEAGIFWADEETKQLLTPTNIVGYYMRMIKAYLVDSKTYSDVSVKPAINKELNEDFGNPIVVIKRDNLVPENLGVMGDKKSLTSFMPAPIANFEENYPDASLEESRAYSDLIKMGIRINIYGTTSAEVEAIGNILHPLIMATSYDALKLPFPFIQYVNPPTMSPVDVVEKHDDVYMLNISWEVTYRDDSILLIKKNVIKYATITVKEKSQERVIYRFDD